MSKVKYNFGVGVNLIAEADFDTGQSSIERSELQLFFDDPKIEKGFRFKNGKLNKQGLKLSTASLVTALITNIHYCHQANIWDSAQHYRYILKMLDEGFGIANIETTSGEW